jgi:hypothetical protein
MMNTQPTKDDDAPNWIDLREAAPLFGMTYPSCLNAVGQSRFPVPTYKLGRRRVISRAVLKQFLEELEAQQLAQLKERGLPLERKIEPIRKTLAKRDYPRPTRKGI